MIEGKDGFPSPPEARGGSFRKGSTMDLETAWSVLVAITAVGAVVWLAALTTLLRASRSQAATAVEASERFEIEGKAASGAIVGAAEVDGDPEELSTRLAGTLARETFGPFGPIKVVASDRHQVVFEPTGAPGIGFRRGRVRLTPAGSRTKVEYAIETTSRGSILLGIGWLALGLGLAALIVAPWLAATYLLTSPNPAVRAQVVQVCQMAHFLWPPFLFAALSRQPSRMFRARMESLVHNLPYT